MNKHQQGFTLIEIMIALLLSSMLIAAIGKMFIDSGNSFRKQKTLSYLVEDGRYAQDILAKEIRRAGFLKNRHNINGLAADVFTASADVLGSGISWSAAAPEFIKGKFKEGGFSGDAFDINHLVFRYQLSDKEDLSGSNSIFDASPCTKDIHLAAGEDPESEKIIATLYFYVAFDDASNSPVLYCQAQRKNLDKPAKDVSSPEAIALISNVERLYVLYGVDTNDPQDGIANQYLRADQIAETEWRNVSGVRIYIVIASEDKNMNYQTPSYLIEGKSYEGEVNTPSDKRLYKTFTTTIALRNIDDDS